MHYRITCRCTAHVVVLSAMSLACSGNSGMTSSQKTEVADSARAVAKTVIDDTNRLAFETAFARYSNEPDARYVEGGVLYPSLDALRKSYAEIVPNLELVENKVDSWDVAVLGPDVASVTLPIHLRIKAKGKPEFATQYVWSAIIQRRNGTWKVVQSHESWQNAEKLMAALAP